MSRLKKPEPPSLKKLLSLWSLQVRSRDNHTCQTCGSSRYLQAHHLLPKERYPEFKLEVTNGITLCAKCHKFGKFSAHRNPWWFYGWLEKNKRKVFEWVMENVGSPEELKDTKETKGEHEV